MPALYRFVCESPNSPQEVLERIGRMIRPRPGFKESLKESFGLGMDSTPPFIGKVEGNSFRIQRDIRYRNSFVPRIYGQVATSENGSRISVEMNFHPLVTVFLVFWFVVVGMAGIAMAISGNLLNALFPLGMCLFAAGIALIGFSPEARKARRLIEQGLACRPADRRA